MGSASRPHAPCHPRPSSLPLATPTFGVWSSCLSPLAVVQWLGEAFELGLRSHYGIVRQEAAGLADGLAMDIVEASSERDLLAARAAIVSSSRLLQLPLALPSIAAWRTVWSGSLDERFRCGVGFVASSMVMRGSGIAEGRVGGFGDLLGAFRVGVPVLSSFRLACVARLLLDSVMYRPSCTS